MRVILILIFFSSFLFAHKLNIFLYEKNDKIVVTSYFASGAPCKNCKVEVFDNKTTLLETAKTDENGDFIFNKLDSKLLVKVETIGGHSASESIKIENLKKEKKKISQMSSILESLIAVILIGLIFLALKRFKK